jgi:ribonucleoside-diphosphate reductase subunit M2
VEGIFFSGPLFSIRWLKKRSLMPGLSFSNKLSFVRGGPALRFRLLLYSYLQNKLSEERA